jgi:hypothetical protein
MSNSLCTLETPMPIDLGAAAITATADTLAAMKNRDGWTVVDGLFCDTCEEPALQQTAAPHNLGCGKCGYFTNAHNERACFSTFEMMQARKQDKAA